MQNSKGPLVISVYLLRLRTRKAIPPYIRNLVPSIYIKGMFDITWDAIVYTMPLELANELSAYFKNSSNREVSVAHWYQQLPVAAQERVTIQQPV